MENKMKSHEKKFNYKKVPILLFAFSVLVFFLAGTAVVVQTWNISMDSKEQEVIQLAEAAQAGIPESYLTRLNADSKDMEKKEYHELKHILSSIVQLKNNIRFAYIFVEKDGKVYFLADSEPTESKDYSPPGQEYTEANAETRFAFQSGATLLTKPSSDRWGKWVTVFVPMKDNKTGETIAVFGVDYPADTWYDNAIVRTIQTVFVVICVLSIFIIIYYALSQNKELQKEKKKLVASEEQLKESETLFRAVFEQATIGIAIGQNDKYLASDSGNRPSINSMFERITGRTKEELTNISWAEITHPDDLKADMEKFLEFKMELIESYDMEKRFIRPDGTSVWTHMIISPLHLDDDADFKHLCLIEDIGKQKEIEKNLFDSEQSKTIFLENLPGMAYRCDYDRSWTMQYVSEGCIELTGYRPESLINNNGISFNELILPKYQQYLWKKWESVIKEGTKLKEEYQIVMSSGEIKWVYEQGHGIYDEEGNVSSLEGLIIDISEQKEQEMRLKYISEHDILTGLYNRRYFETILEQELRNPSGNKKALILVNIKKFAMINLTYGFHSAETLIKEMANELFLLSSTQYRLFHISIDRFAFYIHHYQSRTELSKLSESIIRCSDDIHSIQNVQLSIGIIEIENHKSDVGNLLKYASIAAEKASKNKTAEYCYFSEKMDEEIIRKERLKEEIAIAARVETDTRLYMVYQPIVDLKTNKIYGYEALARFNSEQFGFVSPVEFIPIAEETGLIVPLGKKIMQMSFRFLKELEQKGFGHIVISFNISFIQLLRDDFIEDLTDLIKKENVNPHNLKIELTESEFAGNYQDINDKLGKIKDRGLKIAIDDFGTGYSSLAHERELTVDCLKIDKSFIDKLLILDEKESITGDIISMAHKIGHSVIAEGVEYERQKEYLIAHNCEYMQGYLFSKPLSSEAAVELLRKEI